jgi:Flp pilus assembly protein TadD
LALKATGVVILGALATSVFAGSAMAADSAPKFSVQMTKNRVVKAGATAFNNGDVDKSIAYSRNALHQGLRKSTKSAAYSNLCAGLGEQGRYEEAEEACSAAVKLSPKNWQAFTNRALVNWMAGEQAQARIDLQSARTLAGDTPEVVRTSELMG